MTPCEYILLGIVAILLADKVIASRAHLVERTRLIDAAILPVESYAKLRALEIEAKRNNVERDKPVPPKEPQNVYENGHFRRGMLFENGTPNGDVQTQVIDNRIA